jgi:glycosyltransferase involved in cell wall biosynthesis
MQKTISIIIPSYNRVSLLKSTIDKIQNNLQVLNFNDYEIVVINNGYSDILDINKQNITIHNIKERMDPGIARNYGIDNSNSEWVWFVDDDDELCIENLDKVIDLINKSENDLIVHSLKLKYEKINVNYSLVKNVVCFKIEISYRMAFHGAPIKMRLFLLHISLNS